MASNGCDRPACQPLGVRFFEGAGCVGASSRHPRAQGSGSKRKRLPSLEKTTGVETLVRTSSSEVRLLFQHKVRLHQEGNATDETKSRMSTNLTFFCFHLTSCSFCNPRCFECSPSPAASGQCAKACEEEEIASAEESPSPRTTWLHSGKLCTRTTGASMWPQKGLGMSVPHPEFPDETTVLVSLGSLITKLETAASSHADQVDKGMRSRIQTDACHVLMCLKLTRPEVNIEQMMTKGGANKRREDMISELEDVEESVIPFFEE
uniref:Uncharacterized protein n=1 Tax=Oryza sativa subsp. japonica TaxID=39947 RepID=Q94I57_ORYSJ|nr:Hypothetical protein [Oryza sativa Japonica Group]